MVTPDPWLLSPRAPAGRTLRVLRAAQLCALEVASGRLRVVSGEESTIDACAVSHRVAVQFHPDWPFRDEMVIGAIARDGIYRSQFETNFSNGGLTAFPGGDRWRWESRLFEARYDSVDAAERPIYGAVDRGRCPQGPAVRFGSASLRLRPQVMARSTFCFPDSVFEPDLVVGPDRLAEAEALADVTEHDHLDDYIEAHVHGGVHMDRDVESIVLDPCFRNTVVEEEALRTGCVVEWHPGFRVSSAGLDPAYRGAEFVDLAKSLGDELTPDLIGAAARSRLYDPQSLKRVWHLLARFGRLN